MNETTPPPAEPSSDSSTSSPAAAATAGKVAIVTGGSRGIGRAVVESLLAAGYRVFFGSRNAASVSRALADLGARFPAGRLAGRPLDVRRQEDVDAFVEWVAGEAGRIDCLVNNAGLGLFAPVDALTGERWREVIETNLCGAFYFIHAVAPRMKEQGGGWILNIASLAGKNAMAGGAAYNASKFGMIGLSEAAMLDLRQFGIRVSAILPGSVDTGFGAIGASGASGAAEARDTGGSPASGASGASGTGGAGGSGRQPDAASAAAWKLAPEDVAAMVLHLLGYPDRALPSLIEMRPTRPPKR